MTDKVHINITDMEFVKRSSVTDADPNTNIILHTRMDASVVSAQHYMQQ
jgi:hypothetical protein